MDFVTSGKVKELQAVLFPIQPIPGKIINKSLNLNSSNYLKYIFLSLINLKLRERKFVEMEG